MCNIPGTPHVYISIICSTAWNSVLPRISALASLSAGIPAFQVRQYVYQLPGTSCAPRASSSKEPLATGFTLTCEQGCSIAQALMHATTLLLRPTCPLLDSTPSIEVGTVDDVDILSDVESSLFHTWHHPQLVPSWVEVCLRNTY